MQMQPSKKQWCNHISQKDPIYKTSAVPGNTDGLAESEQRPSFHIPLSTVVLPDFQIISKSVQT